MAWSVLGASRQAGTWHTVGSVGLGLGLEFQPRGVFACHQLSRLMKGQE